MLWGKGGESPEHLWELALESLGEAPQLWEKRGILLGGFWRWGKTEIHPWPNGEAPPFISSHKGCQETTGWGWGCSRQAVPGGVELQKGLAAVRCSGYSSV